MQEQKMGEGIFRVLRFATLPSTNEYAKRLAAEGAAQGTVILADSQTAGHGRFDRPFVSPVGGLYASLILRPPYAPALTPLITVAAAVAVAEAAEAITGVPLGIKWVNDVYSEKGKVSGILTEAAFAEDGKGLAYAVLGFGINLYPWEEASAQAGPAACLFSHLPDPEERERTKEKLLAAVLTKFWEYYTALPEKAFMAVYRGRSVLTGKTVSVFAPTDKARAFPLYTATVLDIDEEGALLVRTAAGEEKRLTGGEVSLSLQA